MSDNLETIITIVVVLSAAFGIITLILRIGEWKGNVNSDRENFKSFIEKVEKRLEDIADKISRLSSKTLENNSPVSLTELGKSISQEINASNWAEGIALKFVDDLQGSRAYEIEKFSFSCLRGNKAVLSEAMNEKIEICAYEHGLPKTEILDVLAVELRDELLKLLKIDS